MESNGNNSTVVLLSPLHVKKSSHHEPEVTQMTTKSIPTRQPRTHSVSKHITMEILRPHFEKPLVDVAKLFGICTTLMKKVCRRVGIKRWPHRHIRSLRKSIASMETAMSLFNGPDKEAYEIQIRKQKIRLVGLLYNPNSNEDTEEYDAQEYYKAHPYACDESVMGLSASSTLVPVASANQRNPQQSYSPTKAMSSVPQYTSVDVKYTPVNTYTPSLMAWKQEPVQDTPSYPYYKNTYPMFTEGVLRPSNFAQPTRNVPTLPPISSWLR